jgi:hypothetical protein
MRAKNYLKGRTISSSASLIPKRAWPKQLNGVGTPPHSFILNPDGEIEYSHVGFEPGVEAENEEHIRQILYPEWMRNRLTPPKPKLPVMIVPVMRNLNERKLCFLIIFRPADPGPDGTEHAAGKCLNEAQMIYRSAEDSLMCISGIALPSIWLIVTSVLA